jgi:hypothetical protein
MRAGARAGRSARAHPQLSAPCHSAQGGTLLSEGVGVVQAGCKPAPRSGTQSEHSRPFAGEAAALILVAHCLCTQHGR